jgi:hypothetical protein
MSDIQSDGIDSSIPLQAGRGVQQQNPLQAIGQFANIQNAINQSKLFPLQQQQMEIATQREGIGLKSDQSGLIQKQRQLGYASLAPLLAKKGALTLDDVTSGLAGFEKSGGVSAPVLNEMQHIQLTGDPAVDDATFRAHILANAQAPAAAAGAVLPTQGQADTGPSILPFTVGARGLPGQGVVTPAGAPIQKGLGPQYVGTGAGSVPTNNGAPVGAPIANQLSPAQLATPTQIGVDKNGAPVMGTLEQFLGKSTGSPLGTGRQIPAALRGPNAPPQGVVTGVGPAQQAALTTTGGNSANAFNEITTQGVAARSQGAVLDNMLADTAQFTTGPGAETIQKLREVGTRLGFPVDKDATSASESFNKLASQLADAQGAGSDARLAVNQAANPHATLSPGGVDLILRQLRGNADYLQARQALAAGYPDKADRSGFESKVGANLDPRIFQYSRMTPEQKATYFGSLKDKATFKKAYGWAQENGLMGGANGAQ